MPLTNRRMAVDPNTKWNLNSLYDHLHSLITYVDDKSDLRINATLAEMHKIESINDVKHETMNGIREQLTDQAETFLRKDEYKLAHANLQDKLDSLSKVVWTGLGVWLVLQLLIAAVLILVFKK